MGTLLNNIIKKVFFNEETVIFALLLLSFFLLLFLFGNVLMPILISVVIAFLLNGLVTWLSSIGLKRTWALIFSFFVFFGSYAAVFFLLPLIGSQINSLLNSLPSIVNSFQDSLINLSTSYPDIISPEAVSSFLANLTNQVNTILSQALSQLAGTISFAFNAVLYAVLIPLMVFFFVKDKSILLPLISTVLPKDHRLLDDIYIEMNEQLFNYVTGKSIEIIIIAIVSYIAFSFLNLPYAILLAILVGLSVIIPFFGAILVTIPVLLIGLAEWGVTDQFYWLLFIYLLIQILDGNLLVPLLFSARNNLHPVIIVVAVLFFNGIWGFWGLFFAIPLATFVKAIVNSWPKNNNLNLDS
ncbi:MAG: AI-2E family transporter [SAR86 cluster bacterium]|jgi:putative permease|nr:AI-2E family transporter [SAR86 cluster bacterium]